MNNQTTDECSKPTDSETIARWLRLRLDADGGTTLTPAEALHLLLMVQA